MILQIILVLTSVAAIASIINLFDSKYGVRNKKKSLMKVELSGNLPIISLFNKEGKVMNFIIDSGSNISHICSDYYDDLKATLIGTYKEGSVEGLGASNVGITMCKATLTDINRNVYNIELSVSEQLNVIAKSIEESTGIKVHGLLGTDFLCKHKYILDFASLEVYNKK